MFTLSSFTVFYAIYNEPLHCYTSMNNILLTMNLYKTGLDYVEPGRSTILKENATYTQ